MGQSYFIWKNVDCRAMGVRLSAPAAIIRPEERVDHITIPGRSGDLTMLEGENIYNSYIQTVTIMAHGAARIRQIYDWLRGSGYVTFSGEPEKKQPARIIGAVTLSRHSYNLDWWEGEVQFYCSPIKTDPEEVDVEITSSGATVNNPGDMTAFPLIEVIGSGAVTVSSGGKVLTIPECTSGWVIDSENQWILSGNTPQGNVCSGDFPVLVPGSNTVAFTGSITKLVITPRFRYL